LNATHYYWWLCKKNLQNVGISLTPQPDFAMILANAADDRAAGFLRAAHLASHIHSRFWQYG
jgi:hypothetical protein